MTSISYSIKNINDTKTSKLHTPLGFSAYGDRELTTILSIDFTNLGDQMSTELFKSRSISLDIYSDVQSKFLDHSENNLRFNVIILPSSSIRNYNILNKLPITIDYELISGKTITTEQSVNQSYNQSGSNDNVDCCLYYKSKVFGNLTINIPFITNFSLTNATKNNPWPLNSISLSPRSLILESDISKPLNGDTCYIHFYKTFIYCLDALIIINPTSLITNTNYSKFDESKSYPIPLTMSNRYECLNNYLTPAWVLNNSSPILKLHFNHDFYNTGNYLSTIADTSICRIELKEPTHGYDIKICDGNMKLIFLINCDFTSKNFQLKTNLNTTQDLVIWNCPLLDILNDPIAIGPNMTYHLVYFTFRFVKNILKFWFNIYILDPTFSDQSVSIHESINMNNYYKPIGDSSENFTSELINYTDDKFVAIVSSIPDSAPLVNSQPPILFKTTNQNFCFPGLSFNQLRTDSVILNKFSFPIFRPYFSTTLVNTACILNEYFEDMDSITSLVDSIIIKAKHEISGGYPEELEHGIIKLKYSMYEFVNYLKSKGITNISSELETLKVLDGKLKSLESTVSSLSTVVPTDPDTTDPNLPITDFSNQVAANSSSIQSNSLSIAALESKFATFENATVPSIYTAIKNTNDQTLIDFDARVTELSYIIGDLEIKFEQFTTSYNSLGIPSRLNDNELKIDGFSSQIDLISDRVSKIESSVSNIHTILPPATRSSFNTLITVEPSIEYLYYNQTYLPFYKSFLINEDIFPIYAYSGYALYGTTSISKTNGNHYVILDPDQHDTSLAYDAYKKYSLHYDLDYLLLFNPVRITIAGVNLILINTTNVSFELFKLRGFVFLAVVTRPVEFLSPLPRG